MSDKLPLNKNTLTSLKTDLRDYRAALPVFEVKVQQLKKEVRRTEKKIQQISDELRHQKDSAKEWAGVMAELPSEKLPGLVINAVHSTEEEVAGVTLSRFHALEFEEHEPDLNNTQLWTDAVTLHLRGQVTRQAQLDLERRNVERLTAELAEARRMENALKEIFIPQAEEHIRRIAAYLGDVERLAIASAKLMKRLKERQNQVL